MKEKFSEYVKSIIDQDIELSVKISLISKYGNDLLSQQFNEAINPNSSDD